MVETDDRIADFRKASTLIQTTKKNLLFFSSRFIHEINIILTYFENVNLNSYPMKYNCYEIVCITFRKLKIFPLKLYVYTCEYFSDSIVILIKDFQTHSVSVLKMIDHLMCIPRYCPSLKRTLIQIREAIRM